MDARQRRRKKEKDAKRKARAVNDPPKPCWPPLHGPDAYTDEDRYGVAIHPASAGLGSCSRVMSDEDWVHGMIELIDEYGYMPVMRNMAALLLATEEVWNNPQERKDAFDPPIITYWGSFLPLPSSLLMFTNRPSDNCYLIAVSPMYMGTSTFMAGLKYALWIRCVGHAIKLRGTTQMLVDTLACLRGTYGFPGYNEQRMPSGYVRTDEGVYDELERTEKAKGKEGKEETRTLQVSDATQVDAAVERQKG